MSIGSMLMALLLLCLMSPAGPVYAEESGADVPQLQQAQVLIKSGKPAEAYALLQPLELELAGNVRYDYLLGISALDAGNANQAVFALERVQETDPQYGDANLWLAIAYYRSGDMERATAAFNAVVSSSQNPNAVVSAKQYLATIASAGNGGREATGAGVLGKVEFGIGYDDNISNISSNNPGATQLANTLSTPSSHLGGPESIMDLGLEARTHMAGDYAFLSVDNDLRKYPNHGVMNSRTTIAKGGMNYTSDAGSITRIDLARREFRQEGFTESIVDYDYDYNINGAEWNSRIKLSEHDFLGVLAQYNKLHFAKFSQDDTHQVMLGANLMHVFQTSGNPVFYLGYTHVGDTAVQTKPSYNLTYHDGLTDAGRISTNYTLYLQYSLDQDFDIFSADYLNYRRDTGAYARDAVIAYGEDRTKYVSLGFNWRPVAKWTLGAEVAHTSNTSNVAVYSYRKTEGRLTLKREFDTW